MLPKDWSNFSTEKKTRMFGFISVQTPADFIDNQIYSVLKEMFLSHEMHNVIRSHHWKNL